MYQRANLSLPVTIAKNRLQAALCVCDSLLPHLQEQIIDSIMDAVTAPTEASPVERGCKWKYDSLRATRRLTEIRWAYNSFSILQHSAGRQEIKAVVSEAMQLISSTPVQDLRANDERWADVLSCISGCFGVIHTEWQSEHDPVAC